MNRKPIRKDVWLIVGGAVLTLASFAINWSLASSIDARSREIDEQLLDIDRFLNFSRSATLEAFEHNSSAQSCIATSQMMFFQLSADQPDSARLATYHSQVRTAISGLARAVTAAHAAATGMTITGEPLNELTRWTESSDHAAAFVHLNTQFNNKLAEYQVVSEQKVKRRRSLLKTQNRLSTKRARIGHITQLIQLLGILTILAKDLVTSAPAVQSSPRATPADRPASIAA